MGERIESLAQAQWVLQDGTFEEVHHIERGPPPVATALTLARPKGTHAFNYYECCRGYRWGYLESG